MTEIEFPHGDFYACDDPETLTHTDPIEALVEHVEAYGGDTITAAIRDMNGAEVVAYEIARPGLDDCEAVVETATERAVEYWSENFGGPDGEQELKDDALKAFRDAIRPAVVDLFASRRPWRCEPCGSVSLSAEQVEALPREEAPALFSAADALLAELKEEQP